MNISSPHCPCCGAADLTRLGELPDSEWFAGKRLARPLPGGELYRCTQCRLKFRHPLEAPELYREMYDNAETSTWISQTSRPDWDLIVAQIDALKPRGGRVLDFGCYSGGLLSRLKARHKRFGVEINREAARVAQETASARVWTSIEDIPDELCFDVVVIADVVEHVPDPRALLEQLASKLAHDGAVVVTTGDADTPLWRFFGANWWYCFYPEHIAFVSRAWVEHALRPRGWSLLACQSFRYRRLGLARRLFELFFACLYGWFPRAYLYVGNAMRSWTGNGSLTSVPGNGVNADHLLIVMRRDLRT